MFDHIVPLSAGGANLLTNGQPLCRACNATKGHMSSQMDDRPDKGAWVAELVKLNPWLGEPMPEGRWHLYGDGPARLARLQECASRPLALPSSDGRSSI